jgi:hypothetical protein
MTPHNHYDDQVRRSASVLNNFAADRGIVGNGAQYG